jgi:hypothetical protein
MAAISDGNPVSWISSTDTANPKARMPRAVRSARDTRQAGGSRPPA